MDKKMLAVVEEILEKHDSVFGYQVVDLTGEQDGSWWRVEVQLAGGDWQQARDALDLALPETVACTQSDDDGAVTLWGIDDGTGKPLRNI